MPKKYIVETDKGKFVVEVDDGIESPSALDMLSGKVGRDTGADPTPRTGVIANMVSSAGGMTHPGVDLETGKAKGKLETAGDLSMLSIPSMLGMEGRTILDAGRRYYQGTKAAAGETKSLRDAATLPVRAYQKVKDALPSSNAKAVDEFLPKGDPYKPQAPTVTSGAADLVDKYLPKVKPAEVPKPPMAKAPTLDEALQSALEESMGKVDPAKASTSADQVSVGGSQKPKLPAIKGKNPAQGAPGGYVTDNPPKPAYGAPEPASVPAAAAETPKSTRFSEADTGGDELGKLLDDIHGTTENDPVPHINPEGVGTEGRSFVDTMKSTDPEFSRDVHTGAEPKSPEAESARVHHQSFGEMDADYKRRISDPLGALLMALVGGEAASRQPNDQRD